MEREVFGAVAFAFAGLAKSLGYEERDDFVRHARRRGALGNALQLRRLVTGFLEKLPPGRVGEVFTLVALGIPGKAGGQLDNTRAIGQVLYTQYFYLFQVAGVVLLVAMIGAIVLTLRRRPGVRRQRISEQLYRPKEASVTVVKVPTRGGV